ncbi:MAG: hypothetical protein JW753_03295 [Dehalococcoidia bacterium]|nr:hypothetical protein [Dehalococcoidia bacterium]
MSRLLVKLTLIIGGLVALVLGAHGLYTCCYFRLGDFLGRVGMDMGMTSFSLTPQEHLSRLFLTWDVPNLLRDVILWVTTKGVESWIVPVILLVAGLILLRVQKLCPVFA